LERSAAVLVQVVCEDWAMGTVFDRISDHHREWIARQPMFFVATAPLAADGHVNVSPKGPIGSFKVVDDHTVAYMDVDGSGIETIGHLRENGRIVVMFCAFDGPPRILRLHGRGEIVFAGDPRFEELADGLESLSIDEALRAVVRVHVTRIADSCGYGVPLMTFDGMRPHHAKSSAKKVRVMGADGYAASRRERGAVTIDGLPALADEPPPVVVAEADDERLGRADPALRP
jgi:predicted pyridoxine 5'-phosphate oxidase superfamily flavin-nucleotide-binding protein